MRIYITRHPLTEEIERGIVQGKDIGSVSLRGYQQIMDFVSVIDNLEFKRIVSSDAKRCRQMVEKILERIDVPVEFIGVLDEKNYGVFTGRHFKEAIKTREGSEESWFYKGGESLLDLRRRAKEFVEVFLKNSSGKEDILIVSHGIFLSVLIGVLIGEDLLKSSKKYVMDHCALTILDFDKSLGVFKLIKFNEKKHLRFN